MPNHEHRPRGPERRRQARGGRRPTDTTGFAPLVFVIDARPSGRDACEAILAKLRFAVAPFDTVDQAIKVVGALTPDIMLVAGEQLTALRNALAPIREHRFVPIVPIPEQDVDATALINAVRVALRLAPA